MRENEMMKTDYNDVPENFHNFFDDAKFTTLLIKADDVVIFKNAVPS